MINYNILSKLKHFAVIALIFTFFSCEEDVQIAFSETNVLIEKETLVEINIPKAEGGKTVSDNINKTIESFVKSALDLNADTQSKSIEESINSFNKSYTDFKSKINPDAQNQLTPWEASIEGEVTYQSSQIICVALNKYLNTGGIHGTPVVEFLNFDPKTGEQLYYKDFIDDENDLKSFLKPYFEKEFGNIENDDFELPETIGFNDEGVIILYNINEIPSYTDNLVEFTVPYTKIDSFLKRF